jgi:hypothetical protein
MNTYVCKNASVIFVMIDQGWMFWFWYYFCPPKNDNNGLEKEKLQTLFVFIDIFSFIFVKNLKTMAIRFKCQLWNLSRPYLHLTPRRVFEPKVLFLFWRRTRWPVCPFPRSPDVSSKSGSVWHQASTPTGCRFAEYFQVMSLKVQISIWGASSSCICRPNSCMLQGFWCLLPKCRLRSVKCYKGWIPTCRLAML